jgi:hypothetical protein
LLWVVLALAIVVDVVTVFLDLRVALFGALIVFLLLMVLPASIVLYETAQHQVNRPATRGRKQLQTIAIVLAWSSAILVVSAVLALLLSVFVNWPAPLRHLIDRPEGRKEWRYYTPDTKGHSFSVFYHADATIKRTNGRDVEHHFVPVSNDPGSRLAGIFIRFEPDEPQIEADVFWSGRHTTVYFHRDEETFDASKLRYTK